MSSGFIHVFRPGADALPEPLQAGLLRQGLGLRLYSKAQVLCDTLGKSAAVNEARLVLLAGADESHCQAARQIRQSDPEISILALCVSISPAALAPALSCGIDACWPHESPADLLVAAIKRCLARQCPQAALPPLPGDGGQPWRLEHRGWVVLSPQGIRVSLTMAERALILALCKAPAHRASHVELMQAVVASFDEDKLAANASQPAAVASRRLSVLISRLRQKFMSAGVEPPIRSLRAVGYELSVDIATEH